MQSSDGFTEIECHRDHGVATAEVAQQSPERR